MPSFFSSKLRPHCIINISIKYCFCLHSYQVIILPNTKLPRNEELSLIVAPPIENFIFLPIFTLDFLYFPSFISLIVAPPIENFIFFAPSYFGFPLFSLFYIVI